ncbi:MAG TPA: Na+/H+ antiporter subunit E [Candidatus Limnocylindria bacterium]|nr:Na+/H+ antiporter subunit E [Candidatus Limnocylindria bacterium]
MKALLANLLLAVVWGAMTGNFALGNLLVGFVIGFVALYASQRVFGPAPYLQRGSRVVAFIGFYVWELMMSNVRVAIDVVTPRHHARLGAVAVPLDARTDVEITVLANLLTMTPGSLTVDVSDDRRVLYVHAMFVGDPDAFRRRLKSSFERRVLEMFR